MRRTSFHGPWLAAIGAVLLAAACSRPAADPDTLEIGIHAKRPPSLSAFAGSGWLPEALAELYYDGGFNLELRGETFEPVPALFEAEYERRGASYYVRLARAARFAAAPGFAARPVSAEDVVFTYATLRRRALGWRPFLSAYLRDVRLSDRPGWDLCFVFSEDPGKEAFVRLASAKIVPRPAPGVRTSAWIERLDRWPIGTGPYRVVEYGESLLLEAREPRQGETAPRHARLRVRFSEILGSFQQEFLAGRLAVYAGVWPPDLFDIPAERSHLRFQHAHGAGHYALALNTTAPALANEPARRELLSLIEPAALVRTVVPSPGQSVSYGPWPQPYLTEQLGLRSASLEALMPAPRPGTSLRGGLDLIWQEEPEDKRLTGLLARRLAEQVERASQGRVRIEHLHGLDPGSFRLRLEQKRFDLCLVRLDLSQLPDVLRSGEPARNYTGLQDPALDELVLRWPRAEDLDERRAIVRAMTRRLGASAAWCFLFTPVYRIYYDASRCKIPPGGVAELMRSVESW